jgi:hypothetical protein
MLAARQRALLARVDSDFNRLLSVRGMQAYCLECGAIAPPSATVRRDGWLVRLARLVAS